jgi:hypothetical protein
MKQKVPAFHKIPENLKFYHVGGRNPVLGLPAFSGPASGYFPQPGLKSRKTLKGGSFPSM